MRCRRFARKSASPRAASSFAASSSRAAGQARRLRPVLQAQHPDRHHRGEGQQQQRRRRDAAGARLRRDAEHPVCLFLERRRLRVPRPDRRQRRERGHARAERVPVAASAVGEVSRVEEPLAGRRGDRPSGLPRRRQRQGAALLPAQRHQRRDRSDREGPEPRPAGHGDRHRQDLHRVPDHLAAVEGGAQEAHSVSRRPQRARRPDDGQRLPAVRRR